MSGIKAIHTIRAEFPNARSNRAHDLRRRRPGCRALKAALPDICIKNLVRKELLKPFGLCTG